jgi:tetratricopeptide (TPR) repeat protein
LLLQWTAATVGQNIQLLLNADGGASRWDLEPLADMLMNKYAEYKIAREIATRMNTLLDSEPNPMMGDEASIQYHTLIADTTYKIGEYKKCQLMYKEIFARILALHGPRSLHLIEAYANLGNAHRVLGDKDNALRILKKGQELFEAEAGDPATVGDKYYMKAAGLLYTNLGTTYRSAKNYDQCIAVLEKGLKHYNHTIGAQHEDTAIVLGSMGLTLQAQGKLKMADEKFKTALKIKIATIGAEHYSVASTYFSMGVLYGDAQKDFQKGMDFLMKARAIYVNTVGANHRSCTNLDAWVKNINAQMAKKTQAAANANTRPETEELFNNIAHFFEHQQGMDKVWAECLRLQAADLMGVDSSMTLEAQTQRVFGSEYNDTWEVNQYATTDRPGGDSDKGHLRQGRSYGKIGEPVRSIEELYDAAVIALPVFTELLKRIVAGVDGLTLEGERSQCITDWRSLDSSEPVFPFESQSMNIAPLKGQQRTSEKANDDYEKRNPGPGITWVNDIVRGSIVCETIKQMKEVMTVLLAEVGDVKGEIAKCKNRCLNPTASGFRDIIVKVLLPIEVDSNHGPAKFNHTCELQVHFRGMLDYDIEHDSHKSYEYFRTYFGGNMGQVREQMSTLKMIFDKKSDTLDHTVENILVSGGKPELEGVFGLLTAKVNLNFQSQLSISTTTLNGNLSSKKLNSNFIHSCFLAFLSSFLYPSVLPSFLPFFKVAEYKLALKVAERILEIESSWYAADPTTEKMDDKLEAMTKRADMMYKIGQYRDCLSVYTEILEGKQKICGDNTLMLVRPMANLGNCHRVLGDKPNAQLVLEKGRTVLEKFLARDNDEEDDDEENHGSEVFSADGALLYTNIGTLYRSLKKHAETVEVLKLAVKHYEHTVGFEHEDNAIVLGSMGLTLQAMGELDVALAKFNQALKIKIKTVGPNHYTVASTLFSMGVLYGNAKNNKAKGYEYLSRARDIYLKTVGENHRSCSNLDAWIKNFGEQDPSAWHKANSGKYQTITLAQLYEQNKLELGA